ncbi:hypothetical protein O181_039188 [Austropuccinia psidii MF-1]|uniref:Replication protein A C-terminal domain-containing protein n=1 Tax=Austropuccinia psidii MF-1 TaxID=1389203 RepID=A0A9Q3DCW9_9BASI|nr:hypothetical protein [Austropuccinia psidii MF-1]
MTTYTSRYNDEFNTNQPGGFMQASQNTPGGSNRPEQLLRPVTIKQLLDAEPSNTDSTIVIQNVDVVNVSFCAIVRSISKNPTNILLQVEDGTGLIEVRKWAESTDGEVDGLDSQSGIQEHDWIRVIGAPKIFNGKKHVSGLRLQKIEDFNEINYHLLDTVRVTLSYDRGTIDRGHAMNIDQPISHGKIVQPQHDARNPKQAKIMAFFARGQFPDEGVHVQEIARECGLRVEEVVEETTQLMADGELYTTIDDEHIMATNS